MVPKPWSRRKFLKTTGQAAVVTAATASFPNILLSKPKRKLGVALVGLGNYATTQLAPALQETEYCELTGIVTGSPHKIPEWQRKYGIKDKNVYNYQNMYRVADNPDIDVIYIVLPNSMHSMFSIIAANAGKHVWCEKPMATTVDECQAIIEACERNNVKLSIGYRMQHEPNTQTIIRYGEEQTYGKIRKVEASAGYHNGNPTGWEIDKEMGGGVMYDMGVYPLNAARYVTGEEPVAVTSARHETQRPDIFTEVGEITYFDLEFPSGAVADCMTTHYENVNRLHVNCSDGWYRLLPFQSYSGIQGKTSDGKVLDQSIPNQQACQMDNDAKAILDNKPVIVPGEEGLKDIKVVEAIFKAADEGKSVSLK